MEFIYSLFENYGIWVLLIVAFSAQLGLPLGSSFFLMWYGSTLEGTQPLYIAIIMTAFAAILGDITSFVLGKQFSLQLDRSEERYAWLKVKLSQSRNLFESYGVWLIWTTRFLVTGLGPIVNYLLGSRKYPTSKFIRWVILGEIIFASEMLYFGYRFKDTWEDLLALISDTGWLIALVVLLLWIIKKITRM